MFLDSDYLHERIAAAKAERLSQAEETDFVAWRNLLNVSGEQIFERRLDSLGLDEGKARELTRRAGRALDGEVSDWFQVLERALGWPSVDPRFFDVDQPFSEIWAPITGYAFERLAIPRLELVSPKALAEIIRFLHSEVARLAAEPTYLVFDGDGFRSQGKTFEEFVQTERRNLCRDIFLKYPALARCISKLMRDWISTTNLFLQRLEADAKLLSATFGIGEIRLHGVTMGLSDRHAAGFQVIAADFGDRKVLYKPKDMSFESLLPKINAWLEAEGCKTTFRFPVTIDCGRYGWAEWIDQQPCHSEENVKRYYQQSGALLCLAHLLNAKDLLFENIVACGIDPVPIDLETFFQPEARTFDRIGQPLDGDHPAYKWKGSVIDIALLPFWQFSSSHPMCDLSGLGCKNVNLPPAKELEWVSINATDMKPVTQIVRAYRARNEVLYRNVVQNAADFIREIESGFTDFYKFVVERKESLLNFLSQWSSAKSRLIFRPTQLYSLLVQNSLNPRNLESGIKRSIVLEQLYRPLLKSGHLKPDLQRILDFERDALLNLDIPRFYIPVESADLDLDDRNKVPAFLWAAPLDTVRRRIQYATEAGLGNHLEVIRVSLTSQPKVIANPLGANEQLQLVQEYADRICAKANPGADSQLWSLPSFVDSQVPEIERLALYSGEMGVLIFLAAADRALHRKRAQPLFEHFYRRLQAFSINAMPTGIGNGVGGLIYGSLVLGDIVEDKSWKELAADLSDKLLDDEILSEQEPDLLYGTAGLLLALRKLHQILPNNRTRRLATLCAKNLSSSFRSDTGWKRPNGDCSLGFAHGTAGIAYALASGQTIADEISSLDIANKAIEFDRRYLERRAYNWPPTTHSSDLKMRAWCSGLAGMLLSRAGVWNQSRDPQILEEIEAGLPHLPDLPGLDHWCCGSAGVAEVLIHIAKILNRKELAARARSMIDETVRRALKTVYYRFSPDIGENYCFQPSLFRGLAGIGYSILHAMEPSALPCIVAFE
jgi:type 2 lantibiotic biosynthesis protein LanM